MNKVKNYFKKIINYMELQNIKGKIPLFVILLDLVISAILYGSTISDYFIYQFYKKKAFARKTYLTARYKNQFYAVMNDNLQRPQIQNKDLFNKNFSEYIRRDTINIPESSKETFVSFLKKHETVFIKPIATGGGDGILKITTAEIKDFDELYVMLLQKGESVIEAGIVQHPVMSSIHPQSVNSVRIATVFDSKNVEIIFAMLRCGVGESFVDNHNHGGIVMMIDEKTGKVSSRATSKFKTNIVRHPDSNVFMPGFQIPNWDKCLELVNEVARKFDKVRYVGWDIAITPDGVCLIEANPGGNFDIYQENSQIGCRAQIEEITKRFKNM